MYRMIFENESDLSIFMIKLIKPVNMNIDVDIFAPSANPAKIQ